MMASAVGLTAKVQARGRPGRHLFRLALLLLALLHRPEAAAGSEWTEREFASFRLLQGTTAVEASRDLLVGLEVELAPGWQFYSENPGEFGVAPQFDWSASRNLAEASLHWPAPTAYLYSSDPPISTLGYKGSLLLPVALVAERAGEALELRLALEYAVCEEFCIVDTVELHLALPPGRAVATRHHARLRQALAAARAD
jgi:suppressor for copper-sensitivity B